MYLFVNHNKQPKPNRTKAILFAGGLLLTSGCSAKANVSNLETIKPTSTTLSTYEKAQSAKEEALEYIKSEERTTLIDTAVQLNGQKLLSAIQSGILTQHSAYKFTPALTAQDSKNTAGWGKLEQLTTQNGVTRLIELFVYRNKTGTIEPSQNIDGLRIATIGGPSVRLESPSYGKNMYGSSEITAWEVGLKTNPKQPELISSTTEAYVTALTELQQIDTDAIALLETEILALGL